MRGAATMLLVLVAATATWARVTLPGPSLDLPIVLVLASVATLALLVDLARSGALGRVPVAVGVLALLVLLRGATVAAGLLEPMFAPLVRDALEILAAGGSYLVLAVVAGWWLAARGAHARPWVAGALVLGTAANCLVAVAQVARYALDPSSTHGLNVATGVPRAAGLSSDPNHLALAVVLALPLLWGLGPGRWQPGSRVVVGCVLMAGLASTGSRSGALALAVALVLLLVCARIERGAGTGGEGARRETPAGRRGLARAASPYLAVALLFMFAGAAPVLALDAATPGSMADLLRRDVPGARAAGGGTAADQSGRTHVGVYALAPDWLAHRPVFGTGAGSFPTQFELRTGRGGFGAHSWFLRALLETGFAGLLAAVLLLAHGVGSAFAGGSRLGRAVGASLVATAVGNVSYLTMHLATWHLLIALAVSGSALAATERATSTDPGLREVS